MNIQNITLPYFKFTLAFSMMISTAWTKIEPGVTRRLNRIQEVRHSINMCDVI